MSSQTKNGDNKPPRSADDPEQSKRFIEAARKAGVDETEEGANRAFRTAVGRRKSAKKPAK